MLKSVESNNLPFEDFRTIMEYVVYDFDKAEILNEEAGIEKGTHLEKLRKEQGLRYLIDTIFEE